MGVNPFSSILTMPVLSEKTRTHLNAIYALKQVSALSTASNSRAVEPVEVYTSLNTPLATSWSRDLGDCAEH